MTVGPGSALLVVATESSRLKGGPGILAFVIFIALVAACVLLYRSMRGHLRRVDFETPPGEEPAAPRPDDGRLAEPDDR
jgi:hypothetical protein